MTNRDKAFKEQANYERALKDLHTQMDAFDGACSPGESFISDHPERARIHFIKAQAVIKGMKACLNTLLLY